MDGVLASAGASVEPFGSTGAIRLSVAQAIPAGCAGMAIATTPPMIRRMSLLITAMSILALLASGCLVRAPHGKRQRHSKSCKRGKVLVKHHGKWKCKKRKHKHGHKKGHKKKDHRKDKWR